MNQQDTHRLKPNGFTLVEMLFVLAIGSFVLAGATTSYIFAVKGFRGLSNYNEIQTDARRALNWFSRDFRGGMAIASCTSNQLIAVLPTSVSSDGQVTESNQVTHVCQGSSWFRIDGRTGRSTLLASNVAQLTFSLYDAAGQIATQVTEAVIIEIHAVLKKSVQGQNQTADFLSARLRMRNAS